MLRLLLLSLVLVATAASAQETPPPVGPGTRVRILYLPESLPPDGAVFTGTLLSVSDTLVVDVDQGKTIRVVPRDVDAFEVSMGRRSFPYWLPALTAAAGGALTYAIFKDEATYVSCEPFCTLKLDSFRHAVYTGFGVLAGSGVGILVGRSLAAERWVPAARVSSAGWEAALTVRL